MIHTFWLALVISVLFMRSLLTLRLGLLKTTSSSTLIKPANSLSIDAGLVLLLLWIPFYRVLPGLPQCGFLVLSCLPTLQWAITWMRFFYPCVAHAEVPWAGESPTTCNCRSTTLASMLYAFPAWWGFTSARDKDRLEKMIGRLQRGGFFPDDGLSFAYLAV